MPKLKFVREFLKKISPVWSFFRFLKHRVFLPLVQRSTLNVLETFPVCAPAGAGGYGPRAEITIRGINQLLPGLYSLAILNGAKGIEPRSAEGWPFPEGDLETIKALEACLAKFGTRKDPPYLRLYGHIFKDREQIETVLEIGIGSNNPSIVSNNLGSAAPGSTLRGLRDFLGGARIYGVDVDTDILFTEDRIQTYFVDQTDRASLEALGRELPDAFDLIIDDGLLAPVADLPTLNFSLARLRIGGWLVVEEIPGRALVFWKVVATMLALSFKATILSNDDDSLIFVVERKY
ncbi:MAG TPA: hypothetical protein VK914_08865 [bacterium]|jgi:hypothetical protein|nr:hypothetical protein [bacterium]